MNTLRLAGHLARNLCALGFALGMHAANAAPAWQINTNGSGPGGATPVSAINVGGVGFVQIVPDAMQPWQYTFTEHGAYQLLQADQTTPFGGQDITVSYSVTGLGSFLDPMALHFTSGTISMFADAAFDFGSTNANFGSDNGTALGTFSIFGGGVTPLGLVTLQARLEANSLLRGYLFDADGSDLADAASVILNLGVYNQQATPNDLLVSEIACDLSNYRGPGCDGSTFVNSQMAFLVQDGGTVSLSVLPEPGSMALLLASLGGLSFARRRRMPPRP